uniref:Histone deacetylase 12 n=1 Tax=Cyprinus carpio carpio TaxID=630221 RepID=A0A9J8CBS8_CYPCA
MGKFPKVLESLLRDQVITDKQVWAPKIASTELLRRVHTEEYLSNFISGEISEKDQRRTGFQWSSGLVQRCRYETGGTVLAGEIAVQRGLACSTAGGTHHAFPSYGSGFCLLNDLAVAAKHLMGESTSRRRILIVDLDVHQGDGTAFIFKDEPDVFTFSVHCGKNFPVRKQQSDLDVSLEDGIEDKEYLSKVQEHLPWLLERIRPDLVLYDSGVDPHWEDELGRLRLTDEGKSFHSITHIIYRKIKAVFNVIDSSMSLCILPVIGLYRRDLYVLQTVIKKGIPVATVIGGGYSRDIDRLGHRHSIIHRAASKVWREHGL